MKLLPEGLRALFAPAVLLPALKFGLVLPETPAPGLVPLMPVVVPLDVVPVDAVPLAAVPPVEVPLCAKAHAFVNTSAAANPSVVIFIVVSLLD